MPSTSTIKEQLTAVYDDLFKQLSDIEDALIKQFFQTDPTADPVDPQEYDFHVKSYCILAHAALEDYFESVVLKIMHHSCNVWLTSQKATEPLLYLLCFYGSRPKIKVDDREDEKSCYSYLKENIDSIVSAFSKEVNNNHGISLKYLKKLLLPVGLNIMNETRVIESLNRLAKYRGDVAHKGIVRSFLSPEDARDQVADCLELCEHIHQTALNKMQDINFV
ncbi:HEPN domain-containing protein [Gloeobacter violaceus]|uniref:Gll1021 protein n=1 Tax=Gloeobacter violaceus (strain ATCC 29082 / PCC 7421) TaxID=251221 RepID=Q7NLU8_GLOVI|nr:HEPN domain-containing protein [Gloeobacter violaceus]BAC88962.1 gll1021 [Gloeobacter violaceus PCC 7421]